MIVLYCEGGTIHRRNGPSVHCTYEVEYRDESMPDLVRGATYDPDLDRYPRPPKNGLHCPACKKFGLKIRKSPRAA